VEKMRILTDCSFLSKKQIEKIEEKHNAKYVFESQLKLTGDNWSDFSAAVFYTAIPPPHGSNWFGIWRTSGKYMISDAVSAIEEPFFGILSDNGDVIYSRHRQDEHVSDGGELFIGGGRDHTSHDLTHYVVKLIVSKDKVVVLQNETTKTWCEIAYTDELDWDIAQS
jgi:hypothetical protein